MPSPISTDLLTIDNNMPDYVPNVDTQKYCGVSP